MSSTARAVVLEDVARPLRLVERAVPDPEAGAVLAEVLYAGVCGTDVHLKAGRLAVPTPVVLGHETVGRVRRLGAGGARDAHGEPLREGDTIGWASSIPCGRCPFCAEDAVTLCTSRFVYGINQRSDAWPYFTGGWADVVYLQPGTTIVRLPPGLDPMAVIALGCAGPTVIHAFRRFERDGVAHALRGRVVAVQGAGPVGLAAALHARVLGAQRVLLIGAPAHRIGLARQLGVADAYIDIEEVPDPAERRTLALEHLDSPEGAHLVVECTGVPAAVAEGIDLCRPNGDYLVVGQYTDHGPTPINPHHITRKQMTVSGSWAFSGRDYVEYVDRLPALLHLADLGRLVEVFDLPEAAAAMDAMAEGRVLKAALRAAGGSRPGA